MKCPLSRFGQSYKMHRFPQFLEYRKILDSKVIFINSNYHTILLLLPKPTRESDEYLLIREYCLGILEIPIRKLWYRQKTLKNFVLFRLERIIWTLGNESRLEPISLQSLRQKHLVSLTQLFMRDTFTMAIIGRLCSAEGEISEKGISRRFDSRKPSYPRDRRRFHKLPTT